MKKHVYVAYSKDKYRLPVVVADNLSELSRKTGIDIQFLPQYLTQKEVDVIVVLQKWILAKRERSLIT